MKRALTRLAFSTVIIGMVGALSFGATPVSADTPRSLTPNEQLNLLITSEISPPWFPAVAAENPEIMAPGSRLPICETLDEDGIRLTNAPQHDGGAINALRYQSAAPGEFLFLIQSGYVYPTEKSAKSAWRKLIRQSAQCNGTFNSPYQFADTPRLGDTRLTQKVLRGTTLYGHRSLIIDSNGLSTKFNAAIHDRVVGEIIIWRFEGQSIIRTLASKAVNGSASNALSLQEKTTISALADLATDKYHTALRR